MKPHYVSSLIFHPNFQRAYATFSLTCTIEFQLGVNNYGFIVNNNGYVIIHPDLRPIVSTSHFYYSQVLIKPDRVFYFTALFSLQFRETLKPGYNSVDMLEVELLDNADPNKPPRDFDIQVQVINVSHFLFFLLTYDFSPSFLIVFRRANRCIL